MIHHYFSARYTHLSPEIIKTILNCAHLTNNNGIKDITINVETISGNKTKKSDYIKTYTTLAKSLNYSNLNIINNKLYYLVKIFLTSNKDKIFFHSSQNMRIMMLINTIIFIFRLKKKAKSLNYVCWGTDFGLGSKIAITDTWYRRIKAKIYDTVWPWYGNILTLDQSDEQKVKAAYESDNISTISYLNTRKIEIRKKQVAPIRIMVSHSGWYHNNHKEAFKILERFKNEDIEIICPLCYGDNEYIDSVISDGREIFGEKFKYFTELMPYEEYEDFIRKNHIYVTATETQNGLGAIGMSIESNVKVFFKKFYYDQFTTRGYKVFSLNNS